MRSSPQVFTARLAPREEGFNLIEVAISLSIVMTILLGVMASISSASLAERNSGESLASQMLCAQVVEEIQASSYDTLITFNGQYVTSGNHRADISTQYVTSDLVRLQITVTSSVFPTITNTAVLMVANTN